MAERALTDRQKYALLGVYDGRATTRHTKSCPSLVQRGLVRDCGPRRLVRWEITEAGRAQAEEIRQEFRRRLRAGTL